MMPVFDSTMLRASRGLMNSTQSGAKAFAENFGVSNFVDSFPRLFEAAELAHESSLGGGTKYIECTIAHELDSKMRALPSRQEIVVQPSDTLTVVRVTSRVHTVAAEGMNSDEYISGQRRRTLAKISKQIISLERKSECDDFLVYVHPILSEVKNLLEILKGRRNEGNAREVLRQIRDSILDGGYENYRKAAGRNAVAQLVLKLAAREHLKSEDVDSTWDVLYENGFSPPNIELFHSDGDSVE